MGHTSHCHRHYIITPFPFLDFIVVPLRSKPDVDALGTSAKCDTESRLHISSDSCFQSLIVCFQSLIMKILHIYVLLFVLLSFLLFFFFFSFFVGA